MLFVSAADHDTAADEERVLVVDFLVGDVKADELLRTVQSQDFSRNLVN